MTFVKLKVRNNKNKFVLTQVFSTHCLSTPAASTPENTAVKSGP